MESLIALDVAILPPADVSQRAVEISASLQDEEGAGLRLGPDHLPHVTLTQQFVRAGEVEQVLARIGEELSRQPPLALRIAGGGKGDGSVWLTIDATPELLDLHERLMETLRGFERQGGGPGAFLGDDARARDVLWVAGFRLKSSFNLFTPHITLGHAERAPVVEPMQFSATTVAACHLGRFCTCRRVLRSWMLG